MKSFEEAIDTWPEYSDEFPRLRCIVVGSGADEVQVCFEPLLFGQWYVAVYENGSLVGEKVPVYPGGHGRPNPHQ